MFKLEVLLIFPLGISNGVGLGDGSGGDSLVNVELQILLVLLCFYSFVFPSLKKNTLFPPLGGGLVFRY